MRAKGIAPMPLRLFSATLAALFVVSCASTTNIRSTDPEAKIFIDGEYKGKGQVTHTDTKTLFSTTAVRIEKAGCEATNITLSKGEEFQLGPCIGGVFVLVPFLWVMGYKSEHTYDYSCVKH